MSVEEWNSFASLPPWVCHDIAINRTMTGRVSHDTKHIYTVASNEALDFRAKENNTEPSVFSWLIANIEIQRSSPNHFIKGTL